MISKLLWNRFTGARTTIARCLTSGLLLSSCRFLVFCANYILEYLNHATVKTLCIQTTALDMCVCVSLGIELENFYFRHITRISNLDSSKSTFVCFLRSFLHYRNHCIWEVCYSSIHSLTFERKELKPQ